MVFLSFSDQCKISLFVWKKLKSSIKYQMYSCQDPKSEVWAKNLKNYSLLPMVENLHFYFKHPVAEYFVVKASTSEHTIFIADSHSVVVAEKQR